MKKRYLITTGIVAFVGTAVANLPATQLLPLLPPQAGVVLYDVSGTVWSGHAKRARLQDGTEIDDIDWTLKPLALLSAGAAADVNFKAFGGAGSSRVTYGLVSQEIELNDAQFRVQATALQQHLQVPLASFSGPINVTLNTLTIQGKQVKRVDGNIAWNKAALQSPVPAKLGAIALTLSTDNEGTHLGQLSNQPGDLQLSGKLSLNTQGIYTSDIAIKPTASTPADLRGGLNLMGQPRSDGSYRLKQTGNINTLR